MRKAAILVDMFWIDVIVFLTGVCFCKLNFADSLFTILHPALVWYDYKVFLFLFFFTCQWEGVYLSVETIHENMRL